MRHQEQSNWEGEWNNNADLGPLVERGRQLHSRAIFDASARILNCLKRLFHTSDASNATGVRAVSPVSPEA